MPVGISSRVALRLPMAEKMQGIDKSREVFSMEVGNVVSIAHGAGETWHIQCTSGGLCPRPLKPA